MSQIKETQEVKLFIDQDNVAKQEAMLTLDDPCGPWLNVSHSGEEFSLSLENWDKLSSLVESVKRKAGITPYLQPDWEDDLQS